MDPTVTKTQAYIYAARPKTLTASLVPALVGTVLAKTEGGRVDWIIGLNAILCAILIQAGINYFNDAIDFEKGSDTAERLGPPRASLMGWLTADEVKYAAWTFYFLAAFFAIPLIVHGGSVILALLLICLAGGYMYTGGPYPLSYTGWGDVAVVLFFGLVITGTAYYLQTGMVDQKAGLAGLQLGLFATAIIAVNNTRDIKQDKQAKKKTIPVRFGLIAGKLEITLCLVLPFFLNLYWSRFGLDMLTFLPLCLFPLAYVIQLGVWRQPPGKIYNGFLGLAALLHLSFGLLLVTAIYLQYADFS